MKTARIVLIALFVLAATFIGQPADADRYLGRQVQITDGRGSAGTPAPLVVAMHGFLGSAANMRKKTNFDAYARHHGFIVAYPNGKRRRWNDGRSADNRVDDVGYLSSLIKKLIAEGKVDPRRVYLTGHSNGGGMAMRLACERPDLIRAISIVATKSALNFQCRAGAAMPAIFFHGTQDPISPHNGRSGASRLGGALSSAETIKIWQKRNRCANKAQRRTVDAKNDGTSVQITRFTRCAASLTYIELIGHGHDWPSPQGKATLLQGPASKEIDATSLTWQFFEQLK